jgi:hypothetical protein
MVGEVEVRLCSNFMAFQKGAGILGPLKCNGYFQLAPHRFSTRCPRVGACVRGDSNARVPGYCGRKPDW